MVSDRPGLASRIDHLVVAAPALEVATNYIERLLGVAATPGGRHAAWGTRNALLALGPDAYLEIVGPDPDRDPGHMPTLFGIDRLEAPRLVTWAAKTRDLERSVAVASRGGLRLGRVNAGTRMTPEGAVLTWRLTDPFADRAGGVVPFLIDWGMTPSPGRSAAPGCRLLDLRAEHPEAEQVRGWLATLELELPVTVGRRPALVATIQTPLGPVQLA
jgi:hypothetical protein